MMGLVELSLTILKVPKTPFLNILFGWAINARNLFEGSGLDLMATNDVTGDQHNVYQL